MKVEKVFKLNNHSDRYNFLITISDMLKITRSYPSKVKIITNPDGSITLINIADEERKRDEWIHEHYYQLIHHPNATGMVVDGKRTVVSYYTQFDGRIHMGTSCPVNGDKYDEKTGIAVAFAKAMGEKIPDFI